MIKQDAQTISRYIKSCETLEQVELCDRMVWNFSRKYRKGKNFFIEAYEALFYKDDYNPYLDYLEALHLDILDKRDELC